MIREERVEYKHSPVLLPVLKSSVYKTSAPPDCAAASINGVPEGNLQNKELGGRFLDGIRPLLTDSTDATMILKVLDSGNFTPEERSGLLLDRAKMVGETRPMDREHVIAKLRAHERQLKDAGIVRLSLFGSTARGDAGPDSDVDLLAEFDNTRRFSLLDVIHIENQISDLLGCKVDLAEEGKLKPRVQKSVEAEVVRAF
jgi:predicted nucleotidyltransferase